jgi:NAD(P)-dependent dehydrogenase (short-subunit alcohol dehydrogenase family)
MNSSTKPVVLLTGSSAGIGRAAAIEIASRGAGVIITYNSHAEDAAAAVELIRAGGGTAAALPLDVGNSDSFSQFTAEIRSILLENWGITTLRALVNNAGFGGGSAFEQMTEELFDQYYRVLLRGPYFLTQALLPLLEDGGAIVSTASSSVHPGDTEPGYSGYAAMKSGLITASRFLAKELAYRGIRVNTISPGPTRTRLGDDAFERFPEVIAPLAAKTAFARIGEPDDIAKVIAFLVSSESAWITGQDLLVSGGYAL